MKVAGRAVLRVPQPTRIERAYRAKLNAMTELLMRIAQMEWTRLMRIYGDRWNAPVTDSLAQDAFDYKAIVAIWKQRVGIGFAQVAAETPEALARAFTKQLDLFNQESVGASFEAVVGIRPFAPDMRHVVDQSIAENVALITKMPDELLARLESKVLESASRGQRHEKFSGLVQETLGVGERRGALIARDQTAKINSRLNEERQKSAGIDEYIWTTVGDDRVVGTPGGMYPEGNDRHGDHFEREGKTFKWSDPPHDGHPGFAINCRCRALPVVDKLLDDQDAMLQSLISS